MHWFLILTILTNDGAAIAEIGPFVNENNCTKASNKWLIDAKKKLNNGRSLKLSAICVQR